MERWKECQYVACHEYPQIKALIFGLTINSVDTEHRYFTHSRIPRIPGQGSPNIDANRILKSKLPTINAPKRLAPICSPVHIECCAKHHIRQIYASLRTEESTQGQLFPYYLSHCDASSDTSLTQYSEQCSQHRDGKSEDGGTNFYGRIHHHNREIVNCSSECWRATIMDTSWRIDVLYSVS